MRRRTFLKQSFSVGAASLLLPAGSRSGPPKNETLQLGMVGTGRQGHGDMKNALGAGLGTGINARVVAVCDVDARRANHARNEAERFYKNQGESSVAVKAYRDFRELLARADIDAVIIAVPDHWHALLGIAAARAGKHIYLEKPLTYSIPEGQALVQAVRTNGVVLQTGSQQRSSVYFRQACTMVRNQWLGKLHTVEVQVPTDSGRAKDPPTAVPETLDYDLWQGPCPEQPYIEARVHPQKGFGRPGWLQVERHCLGMITGWGSHMYDIAQWGMGTDRNTGPTEISCTGDFPDRGLFNVHVGYRGTARYADGVNLVSKSGSPGVKFVTEEGWVYCARGRFDCSDKALLRRKPTDKETTLYYSRDHMKDFLTAARAGTDPACPVEVGHRSNTVCILHHLSMKLGGRTIKWNPEKETIEGDTEAAGMLKPTLRDPWNI